MEKIYYKHMIVTSGNPDDVEKAINTYIENTIKICAEKICSIKIIYLNVLPERVKIENVEGIDIPKYWYHISLAYTSTEK